jgi:hypothetical protein
LAILGELGYTQLFTDTTIDKALVDALIETARYTPNSILESPRWEEQGAAVRTLIQISIHRDTDEYLSEVIASCDLLRAAKGGFPKDLQFVEIVRNLGQLVKFQKIRDYLLQIAQQEPLFLDDPDSSIWAPAFVGGAAKIAVSILAQEEDHEAMISLLKNSGSSRREQLAALLGQMDQPDLSDQQ